MTKAQLVEAIVKENNGKIDEIKRCGSEHVSGAHCHASYLGKCF